MMTPDRATLARDLGMALATPKPAERINALLRAVLTAEPVASEPKEQRLMRSISERLDVASGEANRLLPLAQNVQALLDAACSNEAVELLVELIAERERVLDVLRKYAQGMITRTSFLSFIAEQRWPERVRQRIIMLSPTEIESMTKALEERNMMYLEALLTV